MSGRVELLAPLEIGAPSFASSKCVPPTRRDTKTCLTPLWGPSSHTTHGTVALPRVMVPAATRGYSASALVSLFRDQPASAVSDAAQPPKWFVPLASSSALVWLPTTVQLKPPRP